MSIDYLKAAEYFREAHPASREINIDVLARWIDTGRPIDIPMHLRRVIQGEVARFGGALKAGEIILPADEPQPPVVESERAEVEAQGFDTESSAAGETSPPDIAPEPEFAPPIEPETPADETPDELTAENGGDTITVLTSRGPLLTKRWCADGTIEPYGTAKRFAIEQHRVANIEELSAILRSLEAKPRSCIIRGRPNGTPNPEGLRQNIYFDDTPLRAILIDSDKYVPPLLDPVHEAEAAIEEFIRERLPAAFHSASYHWQLSSSAGHPSKAGTLRVHLWFWLAEPRNGAELNAWSRTAKLEAAIDTAVFRPVQPHYTAAPVFDDGVTDPVPRRSGFVRKESDSVSLELDAATLAAVDTERAAIERGELDVDAGEDEFTAYLAERNLIRHDFGDGRYSVDCPRAALHTTGDGDLTKTIVYSENAKGTRADGSIFGKYGFSCRHTSCQTEEAGGRITIRDFPPFTEWQAEQIGESFEGEDALAGERNNAQQEAIRERNAAKEEHRNDTGNSNILMKIAKGDVRYLPKSKLWIVWDGKRWHRDEARALITAFAKRVCAIHKQRAEKLENQPLPAGLDESARRSAEKARAKQIDSLRSWALTSGNKIKIDAMIDLTGRTQEIVLSEDQLDRKPFLLGVANGVVDLHTGKLMPDSRDQFITLRSPVEYDPNAKCPLWEQTFAEILGEPIDPEGRNQLEWRRRPEFEEYVRRILGYCMTGSVDSQAFFVGEGEGSNGKNVLVDAVADILGPLAIKLNPSVVLALRNAKGDDDDGRASPDRVRLLGARLAVVSESKDGQRFNSARLKSLTGDDRQEARDVHKSGIEYEATAKIFLMTNHLPGVDELDKAFKGRLHLLDFKRRWNRPGEVDTDPLLPSGNRELKHLLRKERPGILAWLVRAAVDYLKAGVFSPPKASVDVHRTYIASQDSFAKFIDECEMVIDPKDGGTPARELHEAFESFCRRARIASLTENAFGRRMRDAKVPHAVLGTTKRKVYALRPPVESSF